MGTQEEASLSQEQRMRKGWVLWLNRLLGGERWSPEGDPYSHSLFVPLGRRA
jgi:hypothetical protein